MTKPVVAAYVRVSSASQGNAMQRAAILRMAEARGIRVSRWYSDTMSGGTLDRPELVRLRADVRAGQIQKLVVFRLDRLTRTGMKDTISLIEEFRRFGCELVSVSDGFDMSGPASEIVLAVIAWAAQVERTAIGERISAARQRKEAGGGTWGRPSRMAKLEVERAQKLRSEGRTIRAIAVALKIPRATVARAVVSQKPAPKKQRREASKRAARRKVAPVSQ